MKFTIVDKIKAKIRGTIDLDKLKKDGLIFGKNFDTQYGVIIDPGHCWLIEIGDNVTLAPRVHILAHDASMKKFLGYTKIAPVKIGNNVFVGGGSIILPGITIEDNVIIAAGSVVSKDLKSGGIYAGCPASKIGELSEFLEKNKLIRERNPFYDESYIIGNITEEKKKKMKEELNKNKVGFIV